MARLRAALAAAGVACLLILVLSHCKAAPPTTIATPAWSPPPVSTAPPGSQATAPVSVQRPPATPPATPPLSAAWWPPVWSTGEPVVTMTVALARPTPGVPWPWQAPPAVAGSPTPEALCGLGNECYSETFVSPDGRWRLPEVCDVAGADLLCWIDTRQGYRGMSTLIQSWSPDGRFAVWGGEGAGGSVEDLETGRLVLVTTGLTGGLRWDPHEPHTLMYLSEDRNSGKDPVLLGIDAVTGRAWAYNRCPDTWLDDRFWQVGRLCRSALSWPPPANLEWHDVTLVDDQATRVPPVVRAYDDTLSDPAGRVQLPARCHLHAASDVPHCEVRFASGLAMGYAGAPRWSASGRYALTCGVVFHYGYCDYYQVWDTAAGVPLEVRLPGTRTALRAPWFAWSPQGSTLAFLILPGPYRAAALRLFDAETGVAWDTESCPGWVNSPEHLAEAGELAALCR